MQKYNPLFSIMKFFFHNQCKSRRLNFSKSLISLFRQIFYRIKKQFFSINYTIIVNTQLVVLPITFIIAFHHN